MAEFTTILTEAGLEEETVNSILEKMKENSLYLASEENLDHRYSKLKQDKEAVDAKQAETEQLIAELQKSAENKGEVEKQLEEYQEKIDALTKEGQRKEAEAALKIDLLQAGAEDIDYLMYQFSKEGEVKLSEDGKVVGAEEKITDLKNKFPNQFSSTKESGDKKIEERKLEEQNNESKIGVEDFQNMGYTEQVKLKRDDPETYNRLTQGE